MKRYKGLILYGVFGILTTGVNIAVYWALTRLARLPVMLCAAAAWLFAVLFAYLTNRRWVFGSEASTKREISKEIFDFFACRALTGLLDMFCMFLFAGILGFNDVLIKTLSNILVILLNYIASKLVIFKKRGADKG